MSLMGRPKNVLELHVRFLFEFRFFFFSLKLRLFVCLFVGIGIGINLAHYPILWTESTFGFYDIHRLYKCGEKYGLALLTAVMLSFELRGFALCWTFSDAFFGCLLRLILAMLVSLVFRLLLKFLIQAKLILNLRKQKVGVK